MFLTLGIETSCDDTSVSVVEGLSDVRSLVISSQIKTHAPYGGIIPELAARDHLKNITWVLDKALKEADIKNPERQLSLIAVTCGPGLMGSLLVGVMFAKGLSQVWEKPLIGVNHIEGHVYSLFLTEANDIDFPFLCLVISGGHTDLLIVMAPGSYKVLGSTRDDAIGEAFDKVAKLLDLGYPGGPIIDKLSKKGDENAFNFPVPLIDDEGFDFSFSGLKTAVSLQVKELKKRYGKLTDDVKADICAAFQKAAISELLIKVKRAVSSTGITKVGICGGVSANSYLRQKIKELRNIKVFFPPLKYCTDNAAMVASAGYMRYSMGEISPISLTPDPALLL